MFKELVQWAFAVLLVLGVIVALFFSYYAAKTISYKLWYKDMVQTEVRAMVKPEALK